MGTGQVRTERREQTAPQHAADAEMDDPREHGVVARSSGFDEGDEIEAGRNTGGLYGDHCKGDDDCRDQTRDKAF
jgi:hypothetical protein